MHCISTFSQSVMRVQTSKNISWTIDLFFSRYFGIHKPCSWINKHPWSGQWSLPWDEWQGRALWLCKQNFDFLRSFFTTKNYPQWLLFLFKPSRWHICFIILTTSICVINYVWIISLTCFLFLRRNSQQNVSSVSSLRRTGTTHTLLISTSMGREERDISWLLTRTAHHVMGQNLEDIKSSLTFFQDQWTLKKFQNFTKKCLDTAETIRPS